MSILDRIISKLRDIVSSVREHINEAHEHFERRRAEWLVDELDKLAKGTPHANWRESVQALAYVVGEDGSYEGRAELWIALGFTEKYRGSAAQNVRLHAKLLEELPRRGIPMPE